MQCTGDQHVGQILQTEHRARQVRGARPRKGRKRGTHARPARSRSRNLRARPRASPRRAAANAARLWPGPFRWSESQQKLSCRHQIQLGCNVDRAMKRSIHGTLRFEHFMGPFRRRDLVRGDILQCEHDMNTPEHQHAVLDLDFAVCHGVQATPACDDLARLQRAPKGTEQSTTSRGDDIVDRGRMGISHLAFDAVMTSNRPMRAKAYRFWFGRKLRETERALDSSQRDLSSIDHFSHGSSFTQYGVQSHGGANHPRVLAVIGRELQPERQRARVRHRHRDGDRWRPQGGPRRVHSASPVDASPQRSRSGRGTAPG